MALSWMEVTRSVVRENSNTVALRSVPRESSQGNNQHVFTHSEQALTQPRIKGFSFIAFFLSTADASNELPKVRGLKEMLRTMAGRSVLTVINVNNKWEPGGAKTNLFGVSTDVKV